jgi:hypothetical protein
VVSSVEALVSPAASQVTTPKLCAQSGRCGYPERENHGLYPTTTNVQPLGLLVGGRFASDVSALIRGVAVHPRPGGAPKERRRHIAAAKGADRLTRARLIWAGLLAAATTAVLVGAPAMVQAGITLNGID